MKKIISSILIISILTVSVFASAKYFTINSTNIDFENGKNKIIAKEFDKKYKLKYI